MKKGFTLAEVLITLGIIGVIASLTLPSLVKNTGQAEVGPKLAKFVNTFENGIANAMKDMQTNKVSETATSENLMDRLSNYIVMTQAPDGSSYNSYLEKSSGSYYIGNDKYSVSSNINKGETFSSETDYVLYILKDGSTVYYKPYDEENYIAGNGPYKGVIGELVYDIDGSAGKNIAGREVFKFLLDDSGELIPFGSNAHRRLPEQSNIPTCSFDYQSTSSNDVADITRQLWDSGDCPPIDPKKSGECRDNISKKIVEKTFPAGYACTGAIADNGYKAEY